MAASGGHWKGGSFVVAGQNTQSKTRSSEFLEARRKRSALIEEALRTRSPNAVKKAVRAHQEAVRVGGGPTLTYVKAEAFVLKRMSQRLGGTAGKQAASIFR